MLKSLITISTLSILLFLIWNKPAGGQGFSYGNCIDRAALHVSDRDPGVDDLNDGPYLLWQDDTTVVVFYLCRGEFEHRMFFIHDSLGFPGFCHDRNIKYSISASPQKPGSSIYDNVPRIIAVSDIHGDYVNLKNILSMSGVIDDNCSWAWGKGHLVIVGDVVDRGDMVTECLWFIHRLESEAKAVGGAVHFLLGNHELMIIRGDLRYVNEKYMDGIVKESRIAYDDLFGQDTEMGRWLRTRNIAVKVNGLLFTHAGINPFMIDSGWNLPEINDMARQYLDISSTRLAFNDTAKSFLKSQGPFWYRGYFEQMEGRYPRATLADIENIMNHFEVNTMVVGHTEVDSITSLYDKRIIAIDVPVEDLGNLEALLWEEGKFYRIKGDGEARLIK